MSYCSICFHFRNAETYAAVIEIIFVGGENNTEVAKPLGGCAELPEVGVVLAGWTVWGWDDDAHGWVCITPISP